MLMILGGYPFMIETAAYQKLVHSRAWEWIEDEVISQAPDLQFTGPKAEKITMEGTTIPAFNGGALQMTLLSLLAGRGMPLLLVSGLGLLFGFWVIEEITETKTLFTEVGQPQKIEFQIQLKRFGNLAAALAMLAANPLSAVGISDPSSLNPANLNLGSVGL